jgi:hypothetical protein
MGRVLTCQEGMGIAFGSSREKPETWDILEEHESKFGFPQRRLHFLFLVQKYF